jgi:hypothetical protein
METLKLENIASYLPYGLKLWSDIKNAPVDVIGFEKDSLIICYDIFDKYYIAFGALKPILSPMDLTKPIILEDKEVIPIVELAKISIPHFTWSINDKGEATYIDSSFYYLGNDFCVYWQGEAHIAKNQLALFKWLYANKFDIDGLIEKGLAIDVNTLERNPYE